MELRDRVAIVTGGGGADMGRAISLRLARGGAAVLAADFDEDGARETVRRIEEEGGRAAGVRADVTVEADVQEMVAAAEATFGGATLAPLAVSANVHVNCVVPSWIGTDEVLEEIAQMSAEERADEDDELTPPGEIAEAVAQFIEDDTHAGRGLVVWNDRPARLIPVEHE